LLAIPRPKSLKKLLPEVAALGVDQLHLFRSWRVDPAYLEVKLLERELYEPLLHLGLMQARSTQSPAVEVHPLFRPFVEDRLPSLMRPTTRAFVAHPAAEARVADLTLGAEEHVMLAVGPEGGFLPYEIDRLSERGFLPVSMGARPLRVETACVALLAQISLLRQRA
jgi:RsmE family RNA methyltransferase